MTVHAFATLAFFLGIFVGALFATTALVSTAAGMRAYCWCVASLSTSYLDVLNNEIIRQCLVRLDVRDLVRTVVVGCSMLDPRLWLPLVDPALRAEVRECLIRMRGSSP